MPKNSTGPRSKAGKQRSSRNAVRHGLTAETVIEPLEDAEDYSAFEEAIAASFDPETAVERELILRLASLLWRLRRATSIETALFQIGPPPAIDRELPRPDTAARPHSNNAVPGLVRYAARRHYMKRAARITTHLRVLMLAELSPNSHSTPNYC